MKKKPVIIGIVGASGSGKTYFLDKIASHFPENEICVISQDNYYKPKEEQSIDKNGIRNFDLPSAIDINKFSNDLNNLIAGKSITITEYTFNNDQKIAQSISINPAPIIIVEGIFVFHYENLVQSMDYKIYVDVKESTLMKRRIIRDQIERGYDLDDILYRYEYHVIPAFEKFIVPHKERAHLIIPNYSESDKAIEILVAFFKTIL